MYTLTWEEENEWDFSSQMDFQFNHRGVLNRLSELCKIVGHVKATLVKWKGPMTYCSTCGKHISGPIYGPYDPNFLITNITVPEGW